MSGELRYRSQPSKKKSTSNLKTPSPSSSSSPKRKSHSTQASQIKSSNEKTYKLANIAITILAFLTRFYLINYPTEVVFDEVHFGKFASYYLQRTYFFDLHPPFAKMLIAFVGYIVGYDGSFKFDNIGDSYIENKVPYVAYRALSASLGALTVPIMFKTLQECGFSVWSCIIGASFVLFDNAHVGETRLILLDATLIFSVALTIFCYVKFSKQRNQPFGCKWWTWLIATGVALSCVISTKYVGVFTFMTIGSAVLIDLWDLLDYKKGLTIKQLSNHFLARLFGLIGVPLAIFLFWFQVHFMVLNRSGPGDGFMSPEFQETLGDNILARDAKQINYYDKLTLKHKSTGALLHSHDAKYPLRYEDGRISSQGQQVTGYGHPDDNNVWQILPVVDYPEDDLIGHAVMGGDKVRLKHVVTDTILLTHDVASPYYPTNQEFTTVGLDVANGDRFNETLFELRMNSAKKQTPLKTKSGLLKFIHVPSQVAMWTHTKPLPEWGFGQFEINGNKANTDQSNTWFFDEIIDLTDPVRLEYKPKEPKKRNFFKKYYELQMSMFAQNNALTSEHPYSSEPITWPFIVRGVSFWTHDADRSQIYFHGNFVGWWLSIGLIAVMLGIMAADQLTKRRNFYAINRVGQSKLYNSLGFFLVGWACHYFPFFLMGRQKFLHHYLPAHLISALVAGGMVDFIFGEFDDEAMEAKKRDNHFNKKLVGATVLIMILLVGCFWYYSPLTYGYPGLTVPQIQARQLMKIELHFSK